MSLSVNLKIQNTRRFLICPAKSLFKCSDNNNYEHSVESCISFLELVVGDWYDVNGNISFSIAMHK